MSYDQIDDLTAEPRTQDELVAVGRATMSRNFRQAPVVFVRGEGCYVWDKNGKRYLDFVGGIAVNGLGHSHPRVVDAITRQVRQVMHVSNLYFNEPQILLSEKLSERFGDGLVYLCNSGTEATEATLKLARRYAAKVLGQPERLEFVSFESSFHGRTMGALAATGQPKYHDGFHPMVPGFHYAKYNDIESVKRLVTDRTCGVVIEPIQAEGGVILPQPGFLAEVSQLAKERSALLLVDEVQVGIGRTGSFFAYEQENVKPDVIWLAKALGGGFPIGAMISTAEAGRGFEPGAHGSTFGGNAVACRAALAVLDVIEQDGLLDHVRRNGPWFMEQLSALKSRNPVVTGARGRGFIVAIGLDKPIAQDIVTRCLDKGLLVNKLSETSLRLLPPLNTQRSHMKAALDILGEVLEDIRG